MMVDRTEVFFASRASLRSWFEENNAVSQGIWAQFYKKSTGLSDLSWDAIVEECLCFGWIDSLPGKVDESRTKIYISPRKANSGWSRRNKNLIESLEASGLMTNHGRQVIEKAKMNGSWGRFDLAEDLVVHPELQKLLNEGETLEAWNALTDSRKRQILQQIYDAKTEVTLRKRLEALGQSLSVGKSA